MRTGPYSDRAAQDHGPTSHTAGAYVKQQQQVTRGRSAAHCALTTLLGVARNSIAALLLLRVARTSITAHFWNPD